MKILLTGGAGFIGSHCAEYWLETHPGATVTVIDSMRHKGDRAKLAHVTYGPHGSRLRIVKADLAECMTTHLKDVWVREIGRHDVIVNLASDSHVDRSITDPAGVWLNNTRLISNVLEFARATKPDLFIQASTDEVYGPAHGDELHPEWAPVVPSNPYSASKAAQEALAISYWRTYDVPVVITNLMNMIGERQDKEKFLPKVIRHILLQETIPVHGDPYKGTCGSRYYNHATNYAAACLHLMARRPASYRGGARRPDRFNIVGDEEIDNLEMVRLIASAIRRPFSYKIVDFQDARPGHDLRYGLDGKAMRETGWNTIRPLREAIVSVSRWYAENPYWLGL